MTCSTENPTEDQRDGEAGNQSAEVHDGADDRRSFMRRLVGGSLVAGAVGAAVLPAKSAAAAPIFGGIGGRTLATAAGAKPQVKLTFNRRRPPTLDELVEVVALAAGRLGCTGCGFDGIDLKLVLDEILDPEPQPWVAEIDAPMGF
ncbi:MAG TPA: hypothetical protein VGG33_15675 [Polyangia bacterium]